jgi:hypothetical protein
MMGVCAFSSGSVTRLEALSSISWVVDATVTATSAPTLTNVTKRALTAEAASLTASSSFSA